MESYLLIHSSLSHQGAAKKARPVKAVKVCLYANTVSLHYSYIKDDYILGIHVVFAASGF